MRAQVTSSVIILFSMLIIQEMSAGRCRWRPIDPAMPEISASWDTDNSASYQLRANHLEYHAFFCKFDRAYFMKHLLPDEPLPWRNKKEQTVSGTELKRLAQQLLSEIQEGKTSFTDFKVIKSADFNAQTISGLIILKYKKYPFVLKLFIKTPKTFVTQSEGLIPKFLFGMGGGINRHLSGFTRIRNLEEIQKKIDESPYWKTRVATPRKWFWLPDSPRWIRITSKNMGEKESYQTILPACYGIIADAIESKRELSLFSQKDREFTLSFVTYIGNRVDAHVDNFMVEKDTNLVLLVDTEHFPTMVGLKQPLVYSNYPSWYAQLSAKCFTDNFLRNKNRRKTIQKGMDRELYPLYIPADTEA